MTTPMTGSKDDECEACGGYRSSLTTRNIMGHMFCVRCGDFILPEVQALVDGRIAQIINFTREKNENQPR